MKELEAQIAALEAELAPIRNWSRFDWFALRMYESRKKHIEQMTEKGLLPLHTLQQQA